MKKLILLTASVFALSAMSVTGVAAEKVTKPAPASSQTQPAKSNTADTAGRVVTDILNLAGSALKWTGNAAKNVAGSAGKAVTNLINSLDQKKN